MPPKRASRVVEADLEEPGLPPDSPPLPDDPEPESEAEVQPEPEPESEAEVQPEPEPESEAEVQPEPEPEVQPEPDEDDEIPLSHHVAGNYQKVKKEIADKLDAAIKPKKFKVHAGKQLLMEARHKLEDMDEYWLFHRKADVSYACYIRDQERDKNLETTKQLLQTTQELVQTTEELVGVERELEASKAENARLLALLSAKTGGKKSRR